MTQKRSTAQAASAVAPARQKNLSEYAYDRLLDLMLNGTLPGGTALQERRLAEVLDISRTPIREALGRFEGEGLISRQAGRLLVVKEYTVREFIEILHVRQVMETETAGLTARRPPLAELAEMRAAVLGLMTGSEPSVTEHWAVDDQLHDLIAGNSGNHTMATMIRDLRRKTRIFNFTRMPERFEPGCREHLTIIDAIMSGDEAGAREAMSAHIENVKQSIIRKLGER